MSNLIYTRGLSILSNWTSLVVRAALERSTSTYAPDADHDYVSDLTNFVECSVATYARKTLANPVVTIDDTNNQVKFGGDTVAFGNLESGQSVKAVILYSQVGGDDTTPADDVLLAYLDQKTTVVLAADASSGATTIWVEPLKEALDSGAAIDFGSSATATLSSGAAIGARSLTISALGASASAGAISNTLVSAAIFPVALANGPFSLTSASSLIKLSNCR